MKYLPLVWAGLWRKPARTIFTALSITVGFLLLGTLSGLDAGFNNQIETARLDRLIVSPRFGIPIPIANGRQIAAIAGVTAVAARSLMVVFWQSPKNTMGIINTDRDFFITRPEIAVTKALIDTWFHRRDGLLVGTLYARRYGWKAGDQISVVSRIATRDGSRTWTFNVLAVVDNLDHPGNADFLLANYQNFNERRLTGKDTADRFLVRIKDPSRAATVSRAIDHLFVNSSSPTRTASEKSDAQAGLQFLGDVGFFSRAIIAAVFFMLLFLTGNTMMQSVRERVPEFAILKTLGFSDLGLFALVLAESALLCIMAGLVGLVLSRYLAPAVALYVNLSVRMSVISVPWSSLLFGLGAALTTAFFSALIPGLRARRLSIVDGLAGR